MFVLVFFTYATNNHLDSVGLTPEILYAKRRVVVSGSAAFCVQFGENWFERMTYGGFLKWWYPKMDGENNGKLH